MHGKQSHSSNFMNLFECLYDQPMARVLTDSSHMPKPNASKITFFEIKLVVLENTLPNFGKSIGLPYEGNVLENLPKQFMGSSDV